MNDTTEKINRDKINARISEIEAKLAAASPQELEAAQAKAAAFVKLAEAFMADPNSKETQKLKDQVMRSTVSAELAALPQELKELKETSRRELFKVPAGIRYVVTDQKNLVSPAGFHPDEGVFIKPEKIVLLVNDLKNLPDTNFPLYAHEMTGSNA